MVCWTRAVSRLTPVVLGLLVLETAAAVASRSAGEPYSRYLAPTGVCRDAEQVRLDTIEARVAVSCLVNYARRTRGLRPLRSSVPLDDAARLKLVEIMRCNRFSHTPCNLPFATIYNQVGYSLGRFAVAELLAWEIARRASPRTIVTMWLNSREHRDALFDPTLREIGVDASHAADFVTGNNVTLWAAELGTVE
jgi:uncharacterized protein YkwD